MKAIIFMTTFVALSLAVPPTDHFKTAPNRKLSEYVKHYEGLDYDTVSVRAQQTRMQRRTFSFQELHLSFRAYGRLFELRLKRNLSVFSDDLKVEDSQGQLLDVDTSHIYQGELADEPNSEVFGSVKGGVFEGMIISQDGRFYLEHARHYFPDNSLSRVHSIIYKESDVIDPYENRRNDEESMESIQNEAVDGTSFSVTESTLTENHVPNSPLVQPDRFEGDSSRYIEPKQYLKKVYTGEFSRTRRATTTGSKNSTCSLSIRTDPTLWRHIRRGIPANQNQDVSQRSEVDTKIRNEIISLIAHHVTALNYIFRDTKFDGKYEHRNIKFEVQKIKIDNELMCGLRYEDQPNPYCVETINPWSLLKLHSLENHEDFCLAYLFTYRDFSNGIRGLSFLARPSRNVGGICEKHITFTEKINSSYQSVKRSLNSGFITLANHHSNIPPLVSHLNFARQIGHNFGSPNDYPPECQPGGQQGNFLMFEGATPGDKPNNSRFSPCSISNISEVLDAIQDGQKRNCFTASHGSFCGNKIVEDGEECDCGLDEVQCMEKCCYPRIVNEFYKERNSTAKGCARMANTQCSPSQGPCCDPRRCSFYSAEANVTCKESSECSEASHCLGHSAECPQPKPRPDHTRCNNGTQMCINGECATSICLAWNMTQCFLSSTAVTDKRTLCQLACQTGPDTCRSTADFAHEVGLPAGGLKLMPGLPCDNYQGFCDLLLECRAVQKKMV